jgi:hypothetical protein
MRRRTLRSPDVLDDPRERGRRWSSEVLQHEAMVAAVPLDAALCDRGKTGSTTRSSVST